MKSGLEEALLSSLPKDITAEEIAAIRAAAAAFSLPIDEASRPETPREKLESSAVERESKNQEMPPEAAVSVRSEESTATFASAPEQSVEVTPENIATKAEAEATEVSEKTTVSESEQPVAAFLRFNREYRPRKLRKHTIQVTRKLQRPSLLWRLRTGMERRLGQTTIPCRKTRRRGSWFPLPWQPHPRKSLTVPVGSRKQSHWARVNPPSCSNKKWSGHSQPSQRPMLHA